MLRLLLPSASRRGALPTARLLCRGFADAPAEGLSAIEAASAAAKSYKEVDAAKCHVKNLPTSTKKLNELVRTVRGLPVGEAINRMHFSQRRMAVAVGKALKSAAANAENNHGMDGSRLVVSRAIVGRSTPLKRVRFHGKGRMGRKERPRTHLTVMVKEADEMPAVGMGWRGRARQEQLRADFAEQNA